MDVYATAAQGWRSRLLGPAAARARLERHRALWPLTGVRPGMRVVDLGSADLGLRRLEPQLDITGVDVRDRPGYPGPFVQADATRPLPFADDEFDLAYSSSLIEHLPRAARPAFAAEVRRIARGWFVQTPAFSFPVEPHALLPAAHWLPVGLRRRYWRLGVAREWEEIQLLRRAELARYFGDPVPERVGPLVKSWVAIQAPAGPRSPRP